MKKELITYYASDRRMYDGCPCSDLAREFAQTDYLEERMKQANPVAHCTLVDNGE